MSDKSRSFRDLEVWQLAVELAQDLYELTSGFPPSELYGLISQIRKAGVSIPSNIAEGQGRNSRKEFSHFLGIALGSLAELETQLIIAQKIGYVSADRLEALLTFIDRLRKMTKALLGTLRRRS